MKKETTKTEKLSRKQRVVYAISSFGGKVERVPGGTLYTVANSKNAKTKKLSKGLYVSKKYCPYCSTWHFVKSENPTELTKYTCTCGAAFNGEYVTKFIKTK